MKMYGFWIVNGVLQRAGISTHNAEWIRVRPNEKFVFIKASTQEEGRVIAMELASAIPSIDIPYSVDLKKLNT